MKFQVACTWTMVGTFEVEADSVEEAMSIVKEGEEPFDGLPESNEFLSDSFMVDHDMTLELNDPDGSEHTDDAQVTPVDNCT
jgi:hypothetical protein